MGEDLTTRRKDAQLDLCATGQVEPTGSTTPLECVKLGHRSMPELSVGDRLLVKDTGAASARTSRGGWWSWT